MIGIYSFVMDNLESGCNSISKKNMVNRHLIKEIVHAVLKKATESLIF